MASNIEFEFKLFIAAMILFLSGLAVYYFALLQRSATYAARKIIVLRRLLGIDYGNIETVLPADRLDGANEPFAIDMFPGWNSLQAISVIAVSFLAGVLQSGLLLIFTQTPSIDVPFTGTNYSTAEVAAVLCLLVFGLLLSLYRFFVFEDFETIRSFAARNLSEILGTPLKRRTGHVLYRMRLSVFEAERLGIRLSDLHPILILVEDRKFFDHNGNSLSALAKALFRYWRHSQRSGGSTIYQQLARSNFVVSFDRVIQRKILEWMLAPWLNGLFSKEEGLNAYLCSVRYAKGVFGLPAAIRYYFPEHELHAPLSPHQRFLLIERLSNVSGTFPANRIQRHALNARDAELLSDEDFVSLNRSYARLAQDGKINLQGQTPAIDPLYDARPEKL